MANPIADVAARLSVNEYAVFALAYKHIGLSTKEVLRLTNTHHRQWAEHFERYGEDAAFHMIPETVKDFCILAMNDCVSLDFVREGADRKKAKKKERT